MPLASRLLTYGMVASSAASVTLAPLGDGVVPLFPAGNPVCVPNLRQGAGWSTPPKVAETGEVS